MNRLLLFLFFAISIISYGKTGVAKEKLTSKYAGTYSFSFAKTERGGIITLYPETDSTLLFYIELNRGAPSYHQGSLYSRLKINADTALFFIKLDSTDVGCKWRFVFNKSRLNIETLDDCNECGFGYGVIADGQYRKLASKEVDYFDDMSAHRIYFNKTKPEDYIDN